MRGPGANDPHWPATVRSMLDHGSPTAPLDDFLVAYKEDDTWWWVISSGHHMNLFDAAIERIEELTARLSEQL